MRSLKSSRIYADYAATSPVRPEVVEAMMPWIGEEYGNPSSLHLEGRRARAAIDAAREKVSEAVSCLFGEVVFCSSATEASNLAILGAAAAGRTAHPARNKILISAVEHPCVHALAKPLTGMGFEVEHVPANRFGHVSLEAAESLLDESTLLVAVMHANNELGTLNPVHAISARAKELGVVTFVDCVQSVQSEQIVFADSPFDFVTMSAHKIGGPKGAAALIQRAGLKIPPLIYGGGQEREMRAGTENVSAIVGFGRAVELRAAPSPRIKEAFYAGLEAAEGLEWIRSVPPSVSTVPGIAHVRFPGISSESLLILLDRMGLCASGGSACSSGSLEPSHVLLACGLSEKEASEGLRVSFGSDQTAEIGEMTAQIVVDAVRQITQKRR